MTTSVHSHFSVAMTPVPTQHSLCAILNPENELNEEHLIIMMECLDSFLGRPFLRVHQERRVCRRRRLVLPRAATGLRLAT